MAACQTQQTTSTISQKNRGLWTVWAQGCMGEIKLRHLGPWGTLYFSLLLLIMQIVSVVTFIPSLHLASWDEFALRWDGVGWGRWSWGEGREGIGEPRGWMRCWHILQGHLMLSYSNGRKKITGFSKERWFLRLTETTVHRIWRNSSDSRSHCGAVTVFA